MIWKRKKKEEMEKNEKEKVVNERITLIKQLTLSVVVEIFSSFRELEGRGEKRFDIVFKKYFPFGMSKDDVKQIITTLREMTTKVQDLEPAINEAEEELSLQNKTYLEVLQVLIIYLYYK